MRKGFVSIAAALVVMAVMATSFLAGVNVGHGDSHAYQIDGNSVPTELHQPLSDLWQAYQHLNSDSYWRPFDHKQLLYAAVSGMLSNCCGSHDSHTAFLPPIINTGITQQLNESTYGIGAEVQMTTLGLLITAPLVDSPAVKAGLQTGDLIVAVDGRDIRKMASDQAVGLIHGKLGTVVALTIVRPGKPHSFVVRVMRGSIPSVLASASNGVGYIQFSEFGQNTAQEVHDALQGLLAKHITGLILDLRNNGGGYVDTARAIASEFLPRGSVIFWERSHLDGNRYSDASTSVASPGIAQHLPVVVLVNGYTASAAEILTAALREHNRAHVLGTTTYGKGSVQEDLALADGSSLRITIHLWLTPAKHTIDGKGITPDLVVDATQGTQDNQLQRAVRYLKTGR